MSNSILGGTRVVLVIAVGLLALAGLCISHATAAPTAGAYQVDLNGVYGSIGDHYNFSSVGVVNAQALTGGFNVTIVDENGVSDSNSSTELDDAPIVVTVDVGALHFRGEIVSWYATTTINGHLVDVDTLNATLYSPEGIVQFLSSSVTRVSTGVYMISTTIPLNAGQGDHAMVMNVSKCGTHFGASITVFVISPTLSGYGATLSSK